MKTFILKSKNSKEIINKYDTDNVEDAVQYFATIKRLTVKMLLSIYEVEKI